MWIRYGIKISHRNLSHAERRHPSENEATKFRRTEKAKHDSCLKTYSCSFNKETVKKPFFSRRTRSSKKGDSSRLQSQFEPSANISHFVFNDTKPVACTHIVSEKFRFVMLIGLVLIIICDVIDRNRKSNRNVNIN